MHQHLFRFCRAPRATAQTGRTWLCAWHASRSCTHSPAMVCAPNEALLPLNWWTRASTCGSSRAEGELLGNKGQPGRRQKGSSETAPAAGTMDAPTAQPPCPSSSTWQAARARATCGHRQQHWQQQHQPGRSWVLARAVAPPAYQFWWQSPQNTAPPPRIQNLGCCHPASCGHRQQGAQRLHAAA